MPRNDTAVEIESILKQNRKRESIRRISAAMKYWNYFDHDVKDKINTMESRRKKTIGKLYTTIRSDSSEIPFIRARRRMLLDELESIEDEIMRYAQWGVKTRSRG